MWPALLLLLLAACSLGPGFFFVRRLRWRTDETLCASIALSLVLVYLAATLVYLSGAPWGFCWAATGVLASLTAFARHDLRAFLGRRHVRRQLGAFALLLALGCLLASAIRHLSGVEWVGDWLEHFERALFFLDRWAPDSTLIGIYHLPARPPMMNLIASHLMAHSPVAGGARFEEFQLVFLFLNLLVYFACVLLAGHLVPFGSRKIRLLAALLALSPLVLQNATWTWTKLLCVFYVLVSLSLYLAGWRRNDPARIVGAAAAMAAALLVHYSAAPFALVLAVHYLCILGSRAHRRLELLASASVASLLLATWLGWSIHAYGVRTTFASNTSVTSARHLSAAQNLAKVAHNVLDTLLPHVRPAEILRLFPQPNPLGAARDFFFTQYQLNLPLSLGLVGWLGVLALAAARLSRAPRPLRRFWIGFLAIGGLLGIASVGERDTLGLTHVALQPPVLIGVTLLAAGFHLLPRWARVALAIGAAADAVLGILLQLRMEMHVFRILPTAGEPVVPLGPELLNVVAVQNSVLRFQIGLVYWADRFAGWEGLVYAAVALALCGALVVLLRAARASRALVAGAVVALLAASAAVGGGERFLARAARGSRDTGRLSRLLYDRGAVDYELGRLEQAATKLIDSFLLDPSNRDARYALTLLYATHGRDVMSSAGAAAERWIASPEDLEAQLDLARTLSARGYARAATTRFEEAARAHPRSELARVSLALRLEPGSETLADRLRTILSAGGAAPATIERSVRDTRGS